MSYILENEREALRLEEQSYQNAYNPKNELNFLQSSSPKMILDAGCGTGIMARELHRRYPHAKIHACDASEVRLKQAQEISQKNGISNIDFFHSHLESISGESEFYDIITCRYVLEHIKNTEQVTKEFHRCLKKGGILYLIDMDGLFFNFHTQNNRFNELLEQVRNNFQIDLFIGRKLPSMLTKQNFNYIDWNIEVHAFNHPKDLNSELENMRQRLEFSEDSFYKIFGSKKVTQEFISTYLEEMKYPGNVIFFNKVIAWGMK